MSAFGSDLYYEVFATSDFVRFSMTALTPTMLTSYLEAPYATHTLATSADPLLRNLVDPIP